MDKLNLSIIPSYYVLLALEHATMNFDMQVRAQERLHEAVQEAIQDLEPKIAKVFFNYLAWSCAGEACHSEMCHDAKMTVDFSGFDAYDPMNALAKFEDFFGNYSWSSSYGGDAWAGIAKFAQHYGKDKDGFYIDHIVDLEHNCGSVFNKHTEAGYVGLKLDVRTRTFQEFCTVKTQENLLTYEMQEWVYKALPLKVAYLVKKYLKLWLGVEEPPTCWSLAEGEWPTEIKEIHWGDDEQDDPTEKEVYICPGCGDEITCHCGECTTTDNGGNLWHDHCYMRNYTSCDSCGEVVRKRDLRTVVTSLWKSNDQLCGYCLAKKAHKCDGCGDWVYDNRPCPNNCDDRERREVERQSREAVAVDCLSF